MILAQQLPWLCVLLNNLSPELHSAWACDAEEKAALWAAHTQQWDMHLSAGFQYSPLN